VLNDAEQAALAAELRDSLSAYVPALLERDRERLYFG
jgi:hypothetical protein